MTSPETSNNAHINDDLDQGPLSHHHTLGFGSQQAAPGNYSYRLVVKDEGTAVVTNPTVLNFAGTNVTATTVGTVCTVTVTGGGSGAVWYSGAGVPSSGTGANGDFDLNTTNGDVYLKGSGTWSKVGNIKGVPVGGTTGQVLSKIDGTDYNTQWSTPSAGGGANPLIDTWVYRNVTTTTNPGSGYFNLNSLTGSSVTKLMCSYQTNNLVDQTELLEKVKVNDSVFFTPSPTLSGSKWWRGDISAKTRTYSTPISQRAAINQVYLDNSPNPSVSTTLASTALNAGDLVIVNVSMYSNIIPTISTPTRTGLTFTLLQTQTQPSSTTRVSTYWAYTASALAASTITISGTGGTTYIGILGDAAIVTGANPSSPFGVSSTGSVLASTASFNTTSITTSDSNNSLVYGFFWETGGSSTTLTSSNLTMNNSLNIGVRTGYRSVPTRATAGTSNIVSGGAGPYNWLYSQFEVKAAQESYWTFDIVNPTVGYSLPATFDTCSLMFIPQSTLGGDGKVITQTSSATPDNAQGIDNDFMVVAYDTTGGFSRARLVGPKTAGAWPTNGQIDSAGNQIRLPMRSKSMRSSDLTSGWEVRYSAFTATGAAPSDFQKDGTFGGNWYSSSGGTFAAWCRNRTSSEAALAFMSCQFQITALPEASRFLYIGNIAYSGGVYGYCAKISSTGAVLLQLEDATSGSTTLDSGMTVAVNDFILFERFGHRVTIQKTAGTAREWLGQDNATATNRPLIARTEAAPASYGAIFSLQCFGLATDSASVRINDPVFQG